MSSSPVSPNTNPTFISSRGVSIVFKVLYKSGVIALVLPTVSKYQKHPNALS